MRLRTLMCVVFLALSAAACRSGEPETTERVELRSTGRIANGTTIMEIHMMGTSGEGFSVAASNSARLVEVRVDTTGLPGVRSVEACVSHVPGSAERCQGWTGPDTSDSSLWQFRFDKSEIHPGLCTGDDSVTVHLRVTYSDSFASR